MSSGGSSSEYESGSEYSDEDETQIMKPVFVPKEKRITIIEAEEKALQDEQNILLKKAQGIERANQTRMLVADSIRKNDALHEIKDDDNNSDAGLPDDTDNIDEEMEFEEWKVREIIRLKRDAEEREAVMIEKADLLRRRNMTDEERMIEDKKDGKFKDEDFEKPKWNFMQKYFHKGAFYMDEQSVKTSSDVRTKDYAKVCLPICNTFNLFYF